MIAREMTQSTGDDARVVSAAIRARFSRVLSSRSEIDDFTIALVECYRAGYKSCFSLSM